MNYGWKWGIALLGISTISFLLALFGGGWTWDDAIRLIGG